MSHAKTVVTLDAVKGLAKRLKFELKAEGDPKKHTDCLNLAARSFGYRDWHACEGSLVDRGKMLRDRARKVSKRVHVLSEENLNDWIDQSRQQAGRPCFNLDRETRLDGNVVAHLCPALDGFDETEELSAIATLMARSGQASGRSVRVVDMDTLSEVREVDKCVLSDFLGREYNPGLRNRFGFLPSSLDVLYDLISDPDWSAPVPGQELILSLDLFYAANRPYLRRLTQIGRDNGIRLLLHYGSSSYRTGFTTYVSGESPWSGLLGRPVSNGELLGEPDGMRPRPVRRVRVQRGEMSLSFRSDPETGLRTPSPGDLLDGSHLVAHARTYRTGGGNALVGASNFFVGDPDIKILCLDAEFLPGRVGADLWSRTFGGLPPSGGVWGLISALSGIRADPGKRDRPVLWVDTHLDQDADLVDDLDELAAHLRRSDVRLILSLWHVDLKLARMPRLVRAFDGWLVNQGAEFPVCDSVFPGGYGIATNATRDPLVLRRSDIDTLIASF